MQDFESTLYQKPALKQHGEALFISVFDGGQEPFQVDLRSFQKSAVTFGRSEGNDIILTSPLVSRAHGVFLLEGNTCRVQDQNSTNGLVINGAKVIQHTLADGDAIRIDDALNPTQAGVLLLFGATQEQLQWQTYRLGTEQEITIGRDASCDIQLPHVSVSRLHASVVRQENGYILIDRNSTNGVSVNGTRVKGAYALREKDVILITNSKLTFSHGMIRYCCYKEGIGLNALHIVKTVPTKNGPHTIANDITLSIKPCELVAIIGGSGAGKSTFMNCISGNAQATSGCVLVNGEDLYANYDVIKSIIGYVPQQDIVYDGLTLWDMLLYAAKMRMPADTSADERAARIRQVLDIVELSGCEETLIRRLSGGQKKRASIAVELLSDPSLFFLDEPTSGLDPGIERNLMLTLRKMSGKGKTIVLVTHNIQNLHLCDKVILLGTGGVLCFCGSPENALRFFGTDNLVDVYNMISAEPLVWNARYKGSPYDTAPAQAAAYGTQAAARKQGLPFFRQFGILCARYGKLIFNDRQKLFILLLQAPLLAVLIALVANGTQFAQYESTKSLLFALACSAFWVGILNSIQEICKERAILHREYMAGLRLSAYIASKFFVLGSLCLLQSALLAGVFSLAIGSPESGILLPPFLEMWLTTFLTALSAVATGLFVSALFKNADRAMTVAPFLLLPQILFSGLIFELSALTEALSIVVSCRWAMEAYGTIANLNSLPYKLMEQGLPIVHEVEKYFLYTPEHLLQSWGILLITIAAAIGMSILALYFFRKNLNSK